MNTALYALALAFLLTLSVATLASHVCVHPAALAWCVR